MAFEHQVVVRIPAGNACLDLFTGQFAIAGFIFGAIDEIAVSARALRRDEIFDTRRGQIDTLAFLDQAVRAAIDFEKDGLLIASAAQKAELGFQDRRRTPFHLAAVREEAENAIAAERDKALDALGTKIEGLVEADIFEAAIGEDRIEAESIDRIEAARRQHLTAERHRVGARPGLECDAETGRAGWQERMREDG